MDRRLSNVRLSRFDLERFAAVLPPSEFSHLMIRAQDARHVLRGRRIWNVNTTARGGGVAEMLLPLLSYARGAGIDARWLVLKGEPEFFRVTKRIHNRLHGARGDGGPLGEDERAVYERLTRAAAAELAGRVKAGDVVILHDPQTAGMAPALAAARRSVVWRCHVGVDHPNALARAAMEFLLPYAQTAQATVFSRDSFRWPGLDPARSLVIAPSIDAFSPKNQPLDAATVRAILRAARLVQGGGDQASPTFHRTDGKPAQVRHQARLVETRPLRPGDHLVLQVSRWDALKDPVGVLRGFARHAAGAGAHLMLAGPEVGLVADDPEDVAVFADVVRARERLPQAVRDLVHLAQLPMRDMEENAAIVNALQRHARIIVQKSLAEGFGLTVAEGMWKGRPVVASRAGGIAEQVVDGVTGLLVPPRDLDAFGQAVATLLSDPKRARSMGGKAQRRVRSRFLAARHLLQYLDLLESLLRGR